MAPVSVTIVGIDAATEPTNVGLALGVWQSADAPDRSPVLRLLEVEQPVARRPPALRIAEWLAREGPFLLALDAPLGWPQKLRGSLAGHRQEVMKRCADALDAGLCVLAAGDFLAGHAQGPSQEEEQVAIQEGWIWARQGRG